MQATMLLTQKLPFSQVVHEITQDFKTDLCFTATAILELHHATEYFLVEVMEKANLATIHHKRITIAPKEMYLVRAIPHVVERCLMYIHILFKIHGIWFISSEGKCFFVIYLGGGVSVCVNADRTGQLAPPLFYKCITCRKITTHVCEKNVKREGGFFVMCVSKC